MSSQAVMASVCNVVPAHFNCQSLPLFLPTKLEELLWHPAAPRLQRSQARGNKRAFLEDRRGLAFHRLYLYPCFSSPESTQCSRTLAHTGDACPPLHSQSQSSSTQTAKAATMPARMSCQLQSCAPQRAPRSGGKTQAAKILTSCRVQTPSCHIMSLRSCQHRSS